MNKVSVIVPVYNEEKNIKRCVKSLVGQSYKNKEILLIDNGSDDKSLELMEELQEEYEEVRALHMKERGVSLARNFGLEKADGSYIFLADADDHAEPLMLERMVKRLEKDNTQLLVAGYFFDVPDNVSGISKTVVLEQPGSELKCDSRSEIKAEMVNLWDSGLMYNVWNKLFLREVIIKNGLRFPEGKSFNEDRDFIRAYLLCIEKLSCMKDCFYHYVRENAGSATKTFRKDMLEIRKEEYRKLRTFFREMNIDGTEYIAREHLERIIGYTESLFQGSGMNKLQIRKEIGRICRDDCTQSVLKEAVPRSWKMKVMVIPFKLGNSYLIYFMMHIISIIRSRFPALFHRLRQAR